MFHSMQSRNVRTQTPMRLSRQMFGFWLKVKITTEFLLKSPKWTDDDDHHCLREVSRSVGGWKFGADFFFFPQRNSGWGTFFNDAASHCEMRHVERRRDPFRQIGFWGRENRGERIVEEINSWMSSQLFHEQFIFQGPFAIFESKNHQCFKKSSAALST